MISSYFLDIVDQHQYKEDFKRRLIIMFNQYKDLLNVEDLCEVLGIGKNVAYDILNTGQVKAFKMGRIWKIPKLAVEDYILIKSKIKDSNL